MQVRLFLENIHFFFFLSPKVCHPAEPWLRIKTQHWWHLLTRGINGKKEQKQVGQFQNFPFSNNKMRREKFTNLSVIASHEKTCPAVIPSLSSSPLFLRQIELSQRSLGQIWCCGQAEGCGQLNQLHCFLRRAISVTRRQEFVQQLLSVE